MSRDHSSRSDQRDGDHTAHLAPAHLRSCRFKGVAHDVRLKSFNAAALRPRTALFTGGIKASKAQRLVAGRGLEQV